MTLFGLPLALIMVVLFILGATIGRYLNLCIDQLWRHERFLDQLKAVCPGTKNFKAANRRLCKKENIPILGGLISGSLRKKPGREAFIEFLNGVLFAGLYWFLIPAGDNATIHHSGLYSHHWFFSLPTESQDLYRTPTVWLHMWYLYLLVMVESLVVATFIDFDWQLIPDGCTLPAMGVGFLGGALLERAYFVPVWFQDPGILSVWSEFLPLWMEPMLQGTGLPTWIQHDSMLPGFITSLAGWTVGGALIWGVRIIGAWVLRREAMGFGDVILMAMMGCFMGWQSTVIIFFLAPICGAGVALFQRLINGEAAIPYGPFLAMGAIVLLFGWQTIWPQMIDFFAMGPLVPMLGIVMFALMALILQILQVGKMLFGIPLEEEMLGQWTSADQLQYQEGEKVDPKQGEWKTEQDNLWPGTEAGRGRLHEQQWRRGHEWK